MRTQLFPRACRVLLATSALLAACAQSPSVEDSPDVARQAAVARWSQEPSRASALQLAQAYFPELQTDAGAPANDAHALTVRPSSDGVLALRTRGLEFTVTPHGGTAALELKASAAFAGARHLWWPAGNTAVVEQGWQTSRFEEAWILDEAGADVHRATYTVELPEGVRRIRDTGEYLEFLDEASRPVLRFHPSVVRDAKGASRTGKAWPIADRAEANLFVVAGSRIELTTEVSLEGLVPPLVVDPGWSSTASMATARAQHAMVQLPTGQLLVMNGVNRNGFVGTAELYDPHRGFWTSAGTTPATGNVTLAVLLPTGDVLMLSDGSASCGLYNPESGTWTSTGPMSATRTLPTLTLLRSGQVLVAGGSNTNTTELYDPSTNAFTPTGSMSVVHRAHAATLLRDGRVLVASGFSSSGEVPVAELYDPAAGTWSMAAPPLVPRHYATGTLLPDGRVLLAGGFTATGVTNHAELYDPAANTWTATGALVHPRNGHTATLLPDGRVLVIGGADGARAPQPVSELYDPATGTWSAAGTINVARENHTATLLPHGDLLVAGGFSSAGSLTFFADVEVYRVEGQRPSPAAPMPSRENPLLALLPSGQVLAAGGTNQGAPLASAERYDRMANAWAPAASLATPRGDATATILESGEVLVVGGRSTGGALVASVERYDAVSDTWTAAASLANARADHTSTRLLDGRVLVVGGEGALDSAEIYTPSTDSWQAAAAPTTSRTRHGAAQLADGRVLIAGGENGSGALTSAEIYDPEADQWLPVASLATARTGIELTILASGEVLAMGSSLASTEIYDASTNTWRVGPTLAEASVDHAATLLPSGTVAHYGGGSAALDSVHPVANSWSRTTIPAIPSATLIALPTGEAFTPGVISSLFAEHGAQPAWRPVVTGPDAITAGCPATIQGLGFRGISTASSGSYLDSSTDLPLIRLQDPESGRLWTLPGTDMSATSVIVDVPAATRPGTHTLTVFSNGIAGGRVVTVRQAPVPTALPAAVTTPQDTPVAITLEAEEPESGQPLTWLLETMPANGTVTGTPPAVTYAPNPGFVGTDTFTFVVSECGGESAPATVTVTVLDATPPAITCPADVTFEATSAAGAAATWPDAAASEGVVTYAPAQGSVLPLGATTVTATATDAAGNSATCDFTVTVRDTTAPSITCPADRVFEATSADGAIADPLVTAFDAVTAEPELVWSHAAGAPFPLGETTVTVTARDEAGNEAACSFIIAVVDTTAPSLTCPADVEVTATSADGSAVSYAPATATDAVSAAPDVSYSASSGSTFPVGDTTVAVRAVDAAGNDAACTFEVTVRVAPIEDPKAEPGITRVVGGGCESAGGSASALALLVVGLLGWNARRRRFVAPVAVAAVIGAAATHAQAQAQIAPINIERLRFDAAGTDSLFVDTGRLLNEGGYRLSLFGNYERGALLVRTADGDEHPLVGDRAVGWLAGAWSPMQGLELSARLPVIAAQGGADVGSLAGVSEPSASGLGTPEVGARIALVENDSLRLALGLDVGLPGGTASAFGRQDAWSGTHVAPRIALSTDAGPLVIGGNVGVRARGTSVQPGPDVGSELEQSVVVANRGDGLRGEIALHASESLVSSDVALEMLGGVRLPLGLGFEAYGAAGHGFTDMPGTPSLRVLGGVAWAQSPAPRSEPRAVEPMRSSRVHADPEPARAAPAPVATPEPQPAPEGEDEILVDGLVVRFAVGQAEFTAEEQRHVDAIAAYLHRHAETRLLIRGHADDTGDWSLNDRLSAERANRVRDALVRHGVSPDRLQTESFGSSRPIAPNDTEAGRRANRRVEFEVVAGARD